MTTATLSDDGQVIALACSNLTGTGGPKALTPSEWSVLAQTIRASALERPRALLGLDARELSETLGIGDEAAVRLHALLARGGQLAFELDRWAGRGVWVTTRADDDYPPLLRRRLGEQAPPLLYGAGRRELLTSPALAVVGSRDADGDALTFARLLGANAAGRDVAIVSGGARGVDSTAMEGALEAGGHAVGFTVDPLERLLRRRDLRVGLEEGSLVLATPFHPAARWHAGNAMRRNRLIYAHAVAGVVVATAAGKGGTWAGAIENLKHRWTPLWVRDDGTAGARNLMTEGARALPPSSGPLDLDLDALSVPEPTLLDASNAPRETEPAGPPEAPAQLPAAVDGQIGDLFLVAWPVIEPFLREPRNAQDLASRFDLELSQARAWLKRGVEEGLVDMKSRPRRFRSVAAIDQPRLFANAE